MTSTNDKKILNDEQQKVVDSIDGPLLVVAGPGSGKTEILTRRICNILDKTDIGPSGILALTFTDSACLNMRERLTSVIGNSSYKVGIYTFHSFCTDIISKYPQYFFDSIHFLPADDLSRFEIISSIFEKIDYKNPLNKKHDEKYVYIDSVIKNIAELKKAGINNVEFSKIIEKNQKDYEKINGYLNEFIPKRISKKEVARFEQLLKRLSQERQDDIDLFLSSVISTIHNSLETALNNISDNSLESLSEWKRKFLEKDDNDQFVIKDCINLDKMKAFSFIYKEYQDLMHKKALFDFEDMILEVLKAMEKYPALVSDLEERFQYIMVDEFQDTNNAQMKILHFLTRNPVNEGRPNIMVVGDDDQAIYKFQGAEIDNILNFKKMYKNVVVITLNKNYRSSQKIIDISNSLIENSNKSLRKLLPEIKKDIVSVREFKNTKVSLKIFEDEIGELNFIASEINKLLENGVLPKDIAVISRKHQTLIDLSVILNQHKIKVKYEKEKNIFEDQIVDNLITIIYFIDSLLNKDKEEADQYLPKILSFPFWKISRKSIWEISNQAYKDNSKWIDLMLKSEDLVIKNIAEFLLELSIFAKTNSFDKVIDKILGNSSIVLDEDDNFIKEGEVSKEFISPFKSYYTKNPKYINFLSAVSVFIKTLKDYKKGEILYISDVINFIDIYKQNKISLNDKSTIGEDSGVSLLTAHKAKGLEFLVVFVLSANHNEWAVKGKPTNLKLPINIKVVSDEEDSDDKIRLFYVAITRAKEFLYITRSKRDYQGKERSIFSFIAHLEDKFEEEKIDKSSLLLDLGENFSEKDFSVDELVFLKNLVKDYKMSPTHLNNFLDVSNGGPKMFLEKNILHFPESKSTSAVYGTAMHKTIEFIHTLYKNENKIPNIKQVKGILEKYISLGRFSKIESKNLIDKGFENIKIFLDNYEDELKEQFKVEVDFKHQGVCLDETLLTGKIDKIIFHQDTVSVVDFKTGKPKESFEKGSDSDMIVLNKYKQQLIFYKILIEGSSDFSKYKVDNGIIFFLENKNNQFKKLNLSITKEDTDRLKQLIKIVYFKIKNLDFPDTTKYTPDHKGSTMFEEDLLSGSC